jgi:hypothetical protein
VKLTVYVKFAVCYIKFDVFLYEICGFYVKSVVFYIEFANYLKLGFFHS